MGKNIKRNKKTIMEFTKKIYLLNISFAFLITIISLALIVLSGFLENINLSVLVYIIPPIWVEVGVFSGLYAWKAKNENIHKYKCGECHCQNEGEKEE